MTEFSNRLPRQLYRAAQVQQLDRVAIDEFGIPGFRLMQAAGAAAFNLLLEQWPQLRHVMVFAGGGNNGGDGYIVAGLAREAGLSVEVVQLTPAGKLSGDARQAFDRADDLKVAMVSFEEFRAQPAHDRAETVLVDALLGTGLDREVGGDYREAIEWINSQPCPVLALDIPSGLNADTGQPQGATVRADLTITFIGMKQGLLTGRGRDFVGQVLFAGLDLPDACYTHGSAPRPSARRIDINDAVPHLLPRARSSHKGSHGHVVVIGGDHGFGGAALMAAEAAQRSGAGLVSLITRSCHRPALLARRPEVMVLGTEDEAPAVEALLDRANVIAVGPGLGQSPWSRELMQIALARQLAARTPLVIDADGLHLLAERATTGSGFKRDNWILTPHPGEAGVLLDGTPESVQADRFAAVKALHERWGGCCLLKGSGSLLRCDDDEEMIYLCSEGNAGMASGGMGDVLTGLIAGLVAQGLTLADSLRCGVAIHGEAADLAAAEYGQRGLLASDLFPYIRQLVNPER